MTKYVCIILHSIPETSHTEWKQSPIDSAGYFSMEKQFSALQKIKIKKMMMKLILTFLKFPLPFLLRNKLINQGIFKASCLQLKQFCV